MKESDVSRATLGRIPAYLEYVRGLSPQTYTVSATNIAKGLGLGEVQVRKDLGVLCGSGKPKVGYVTEELIKSLESFLGGSDGGTVIMGAGKLGRALLDYGGFEKFGMSVLAAFDVNVCTDTLSPKGKPILPTEKLTSFCADHDVRIGVIAVPEEAAQQACNALCDNGIRAIWCFAPCRLYTPPDTVVQYENMALSLAHLKMQINRQQGE